MLIEEVLEITKLPQEIILFNILLKYLPFSDQLKFLLVNHYFKQVMEEYNTSLQLYKKLTKLFTKNSDTDSLPIIDILKKENNKYHLLELLLKNDINQNGYLQEKTFAKLILYYLDVFFKGKICQNNFLFCNRYFKRSLLFIDKKYLNIDNLQNRINIICENKKPQRKKQKKDHYEDSIDFTTLLKQLIELKIIEVRTSDHYFSSLNSLSKMLSIDFYYHANHQSTSLNNNTEKLQSYPIGCIPQLPNQPILIFSLFLCYSQGYNCRQDRTDNGLNIFIKFFSLNILQEIIPQNEEILNEIKDIQIGKYYKLFEMEDYSDFSDEDNIIIVNNYFFNLIKFILENTCFKNILGTCENLKLLLNNRFIFILFFIKCLHFTIEKEYLDIPDKYISPVGESFDNIYHGFDELFKNFVTSKITNESYDSNNTNQPSKVMRLIESHGHSPRFYSFGNTKRNFEDLTNCLELLFQTFRNEMSTTVTTKKQQFTDDIMDYDNNLSVVKKEDELRIEGLLANGKIDGEVIWMNDNSFLEFMCEQLPLFYSQLETQLNINNFVHYFDLGLQHKLFKQIEDNENEEEYEFNDIIKETCFAANELFQAIKYYYNNNSSDNNCAKISNIKGCFHTISVGDCSNEQNLTLSFDFQFSKDAQLNNNFDESYHVEYEYSFQPLFYTNDAFHVYKNITINGESLRTVDFDDIYSGCKMFLLPNDWLVHQNKSQKKTKISARTAQQYPAIQLQCYLFEFLLLNIAGILDSDITNCILPLRTFTDVLEFAFSDNSVFSHILFDDDEISLIETRLESIIGGLVDNDEEDNSDDNEEENSLEGSEDEDEIDEEELNDLLELNANTI